MLNILPLITLLTTHETLSTTLTRIVIYIGKLVIASPKGVAISFFKGLLRPPHQVRGPRNEKLFNVHQILSFHFSI
jgi:hypothetical protein